MVQKARDKKDRPRKKAYTPPRLVEYGDVRKLTQSGGHTTHDAGGGLKKIGG